MSGSNLLSGPDPGAGMEHADSHRARLGPLPWAGPDLVDALARSDLRGRGGAAFPVGTKWRAVAGRRSGRPVILVNGGEGEPLSYKDRLLMEARPHLILDGASLAAEALGADEVVLFVGNAHGRAIRSLQNALAERPDAERQRTRMVNAPVRYVSGEETAAVHFVNDGIALPTAIPPRPFQAGVGGRPTLVQNVETLAHVAMIARFGDEWFRSLGHGDAAGTALLTVSGTGPAPRVIEVAQGTTVAEAVNIAGGVNIPGPAVLLGGYFGGWVAAGQAWGLPLDAASLRAQGMALGCGVVSMLPAGCCGVVETARIVSYLAHESARQCGPCTFGLRAIAAAVSRIAARTSTDDDLIDVQRWTGLLSGRGACRHPDGAAGLLLSALCVFADEFAIHQEQRRCSLGVAAAGVA